MAVLSWVMMMAMPVGPVGPVLPAVVEPPAALAQPLAAGAPAGAGPEGASPPPTTPPPAAQPDAAAQADAPVPASAPPPASDDMLATPRDPWQKTNRTLFAINNDVDHVLIAPVAHAYVFVFPRFVRHRIGNVVGNMNEPMVAINNLLQGHPGRFVHTLSRFALNSTIGLGGMFDVVAWKLPHRDADFGQTLGRWGAKPGPYVVLPFFGPSDLRDGFGRAVDIAADPVGWVFGDFLTTFGASRLGAEIVHGRAEAEPAIRALRDSTDPYATARSGYIQARAAILRDTTGKAEALPDFDAP
ncbi:MAG TPA: VacJ family lipoprotein [Novosphingobium sp.]|nr:VacJ family lipoprotein [Novosphingobium sp.]HZV09235.1 VacJ family lipoprotein [Novosphingobium sp.]